jgi:hypothetical protein
LVPQGLVSRQKMIAKGLDVTNAVLDRVLATCAEEQLHRFPFFKMRAV